MNHQQRINEKKYNIFNAHTHTHPHKGVMKNFGPNPEALPSKKKMMYSYSVKYWVWEVSQTKKYLSTHTHSQTRVFVNGPHEQIHKFLISSTFSEFLVVPNTYNLDLTRKFSVWNVCICQSETGVPPKVWGFQGPQFSSVFFYYSLFDSQ